MGILVASNGKRKLAVLVHSGKYLHVIESTACLGAWAALWYQLSNSSSKFFVKYKHWDL